MAPSDALTTDDRNGMGLHVNEISVSRKGTLILDAVSFHVPVSTLTAIIGPNGAGKTTLMRALSGERPDAGTVCLNGQNIYDDPEYWLRQIGYVPVDHILHEHMSMHDALLYIGHLRLPDQPAAAIERRIDTLLEQFGFPSGDERRSKQMRLLSSGERKRANICSELIIDPPILMLDEPTSNLDPDAESLVMRLLAEYAHTAGKIVLVITHTLNTISICDEVIFIAQSKLLAQGAPDSVLEYLEGIRGLDPASRSWFERWARVFELYPTPPVRPPYKRTRQERRHPIPHRAISGVSWAAQLGYLIRRYMRVRLGDRGSLIGTLFAGFSGILFFILPANTFVKPYEPSEVSYGLTEARQSIYVVALVVSLIGLITSYTEISKEFRIYRHERLKGLSPSAYFMSKWIWLSVAVGVIAPVVLFMFIVLVYGQPLPGFREASLNETPTWWTTLTRFQIPGMFGTQASWLILLTLVLTSITAVTVGLLISAIAGDSGKGYLLLSFSVVFIVLFSGLIQNKKLEELINTFSVASTGKWAYEGISSSIGVYCWTDSWRFDEFNSTGHLVSTWLSLISSMLIAALLAVVILRLRDPWHRPAMVLRSIVTQNGLRIALVIGVVTLLLSSSVFLRQLSRGYHAQNYWSRSDYGGTGGYIYPNINMIENTDALQQWTGSMSQSQCGR